MRYIDQHPKRKVGVIDRPADRQTCKLVNYLPPGLPTPPPTVDWLAKAPAPGMLCNGPDPANPPSCPNGAGDCAVAGFGHYRIYNAANAGSSYAFDSNAALAMYCAATAALNPSGGYEPGDETTDCGLVLVDFLNWLVKGGYILAHAEIDIADAQTIQLGRWLFGGVYRAFALPKAAQDMGQIWDAPSIFNLKDSKRGSWGGHCVCDEKFDGKVYTVTSWGELVTVTAAFDAAYASEAHVIITPEWAANNPDKINLAQLQADLAAINGQ